MWIVLLQIQDWEQSTHFTWRYPLAATPYLYKTLVSFAAHIPSAAYPISDDRARTSRARIFFNVFSAFQRSVRITFLVVVVTWYCLLKPSLTFWILFLLVLLNMKFKTSCLIRHFAAQKSPLTLKYFSLIRSSNGNKKPDGQVSFFFINPRTL